MNRSFYLRAYMGGIALPTAFLLVALSVFCVARFVYQIPIPIERAIVFPMALVPNLFGIWNVLYLVIRRRRPWNIGIHGALLPFVIGPGGWVIGRLLGILDTSANGFVYFQAVHVPFARIAVVFPVVVVAYYLLWKYVIGFFNRVLDIA
jgi:hypothetical protein